MKLRRKSLASALLLLWWSVAPAASFGAGGSLTLKLEDESSGDPVIARVEFYRGAAADGRRPKQMPVRQTVSAGLGVVVDRKVVLELPDGPYRFRIVRGPEYRIVGGTFELEKTSLDEKTVALPRMVDMASEGWLCGDCCLPPSAASLPLRMASEDLHVAAVLGSRPAAPIPRRDADEPIEHEPIWIRPDVTHHEGLVYFGLGEQAAAEIDDSRHSLDFLVDALEKSSSGSVAGEPIRIGIENPFAWELPVWLASDRIDGIFLLGDWLRLDRQVLSVRGGRNEDSFSLGEATQVGRFAERIYRHALDAGINLVPLAGSGDQPGKTPVGYNRLYVAHRPGDTGGSDTGGSDTGGSDTGGSDTGVEVDVPVRPGSENVWWQNVWRGRSVATNGPLLRPLVGGKLPGHVFTATAGEVLRIQPELNLAVRDPVDYLEVIHNNQVHYSARLDEFARDGGVIPPIMASESGWVILRVLTGHEDHYRAAITAPWWIEFDGRRRVSAESVQFFRDWLAEYEERLKRLPPEEIASYVPFVQAARRFWGQR